MIHHLWMKAYHLLVPFFFLLLLVALLVGKGKTTALGTNNTINDRRIRGGGRGGDSLARAVAKEGVEVPKVAILGEENTVVVDHGGDPPHAGGRRAILVNAVAPPTSTTTALFERSRSRRRALTKAIEYLHEQQVKADMYRPFNHQWEGNFPQFLRLLPTEIFGVFENIPDISPFIVAFIHDGLVPILESNHGVLQLETSVYEMAREMRIRAANFMKRFQSVPSDTRAEAIQEVGTYGFWPKDPNPDWPPKSELVQTLFDEYISNIAFYGDRVPVNPAFMWPHLGAVPPDADDTSMVLAALLDHQEIDGGSSLMDLGADGIHDNDIDFATFFSDWRDVGEFVTVTDQTWKPKRSGAFVTWINYQNSSVDQDVDLVVNANVLNLLGRTGKQDATPGVVEAVQLINMAAEQGIHRIEDPPGTRVTNATFIEISNYYTNSHIFQYTVSRAYRNGVTGLKPAVQVFVDDLQNLAIREDKLVHWDLGHDVPIVNTALAILTLVNALEALEATMEIWHDRALEELIHDGAAWLVKQQTENGDWDEESVIFYGHNWPRFGGEWISRSWTTNMALQAIAGSMLHDADAVSRTDILP